MTKHKALPATKAQQASFVPWMSVLFGNFLAFKAAKLIAIVRLSYFSWAAPGWAISSYLSFVTRESAMRSRGFATI